MSQIPDPLANSKPVDITEHSDWLSMNLLLDISEAVIRMNAMLGEDEIQEPHSERPAKVAFTKAMAAINALADRIQ